MISSLFTPWTLVIGGLWFITSTIEYIEHLYLLQLKEYRFDRLRDFFHSHEGHALLLQYTFFWRALLVIFILGLLSYSLSFPLLLSIIVFGDLIGLLVRKHRRGLSRPVFTFKVKLLLFLALLFELSIVFLSVTGIFLVALLSARFIICLFALIIVGIPSTSAKRAIMRLATAKMKKASHVRVIGITGSYGKTTTKEFLSEMLSTKYAVVKTPKNINADIGIALFILKTSFANIDFFVVEMGAYRIGEIKIISDMVSPEIGVLTAINEQHLALFKTVENTTKTKYELLQALPKDGLAVINADNNYCLSLRHTLHTKTALFGFDSEHTPDLHIVDIKATGAVLRFTFQRDGEKHILQAPVMGEHIAMNIAPCVIVAKHIGMTDQEIEQAVLTLTVPEMVLTTYSYGKAIVLDDSYNSNPDGFKAALTILSSYPSSVRRIVITRGMLELGDRSAELHEEIAGAIAFSADELILIKKEYEEDIRKGLVGIYNTDMKIIDTDLGLLEYVKTLYDQEVVVLLENRIFPFTLKELRKDK